MRRFLVNLLFGKPRWSKTIHETRDVVIAMPEGDYTAQATLYTERAIRPRYPRAPYSWEVRSVAMTIGNEDGTGGIPGARGEEDALTFWDSPCNSIDEAVETVRAQMLAEREAVS